METGVDPVAPPEAAPLPFTKDAWKARLSASEDIVQPRIDAGKENVKQYRNKPFKIAPRDHTVRVPLDFTYVEQKRAQLFYQVPEVQLTGVDPASQAVEPLFQAVLNDYLGPRKINIKTVFDEILFDVLCPVGYGVAKCGYENRMKPVPVTRQDPVIGPDGMPAIDPSTGQPQTQEVPVTDPMTGEPQMTEAPAWERFFASRCHPGYFRFAADFMGSDFDDAEWVGVLFEEPVPEGEKGAGNKRQKANMLLVDPDKEGGRRAKDKTRWGVEVWYRTRMDDPDADPNAIRMFEWMDGDDAPRKHEDSPYQKINPDGTLGGDFGFPIKVLTLRYVSDTALPPSDCDITRILVDEVSVGRTQVLRGRDRRLPQTAFDSTGSVGADAMVKLEQNEQNAFIGIPGARKEMFIQIEKGSVPEENYAFNDQAERDIGKSWAMSDNQLGGTTRTTRTATETATMQQNTDTRLDYERGKVSLFFTNKIAATFAALIQMFADAPDFVRVVGQDGAMAYEQWTRQDVQGEFKFSIKVNSQLRPDNAADIERSIQWLNLSGASPFVNQKMNWELVAKKLGVFQAGLIIDPPAPKEEGPKETISLAFKDIATFFPDAAAQILQHEMTKLGIQNAPLPQFVPPVNPTTDEAVEKAPVIDKHQADLTGKMPGMGSAVQDQVGGDLGAVN